jgi:hypothetical protein
LLQGFTPTYYKFYGAQPANTTLTKQFGKVYTAMTTPKVSGRRHCVPGGGVVKVRQELRCTRVAQSVVEPQDQRPAFNAG